MQTQLSINGEARELAHDPRTTLLDALRELAGLTGTKKGCDHGQCGACTVLVNGVRINSCLSLLAMHEGDAVITVEGIGRPESLHPVQQAFLRCDGFQCGFCTPGQVVSTVAMLTEAADGLPSQATADLAALGIELSDAEIRERMSGNICRCSAYPQILEAIRSLVGAPA